MQIKIIKIFSLTSILLTYGCVNQSVGLNKSGGGGDSAAPAEVSDTVAGMKSLASGISKSSESLSLMHQPLGDYPSMATNPDGSRLYLGFGMTSWEYVGSNILWSFNGKSWQKEASAPYKLYGSSMQFTRDGSKLFIFGGTSEGASMWDSATQHNTTFYYMPDRKNFFQAFPMVNKRTFLKSGTLEDGSIVAIGGGGDIDSKSTYEVMNQDYTWSKYSLPTTQNLGSYQYYGLAKSNKGLFVLGGNDGAGNALASVFRIYKDEGGLVQTQIISDMNVPRDGLSVESFVAPNEVIWGSSAGKEVIVACGGNSNGEVMPSTLGAEVTCEYYDVAAGGAWQELALNLGEERWSAHLFKVDDYLVMAKGWMWPETHNVIKINLKTLEVTSSKSMTTDGGDDVAGVVKTSDNKTVMVVTGGWCNERCGDTDIPGTEYISSYTNYEAHESSRNDVPFPSYLGASIDLDSNSILFCGGYSANLQGSNKCMTYNKTTGKYSRFADLNYGRAMPTLFKTPSGELAIIGGESDWNAQDVIESYDVNLKKWVERGAILGGGNDYYLSGAIDFPYLNLDNDAFAICPDTAKGAWTNGYLCQFFSDLDTPISESYGWMTTEGQKYIPDLGQTLHYFDPDPVKLGTGGAFLVDNNDNWLGIGNAIGVSFLGFTSTYLDSDSKKVYFLGGTWKSNKSECLILGSYAIKGYGVPVDPFIRDLGCDDDALLGNFSSGGIFNYDTYEWEEVSEYGDPSLWPEVLPLEDGRFMTLGGGRFIDFVREAAAYTQQNGMPPSTTAGMRLESLSMWAPTYAMWWFEANSHAAIYDPDTKSWEKVEGDNLYSFLPTQQRSNGVAYLQGGYKHAEFMPENTMLIVKGLKSSK